MTVMTVITVESVKTVRRRAVGVIVVVRSEKREVPFGGDEVTEGVTVDAQNEGHRGLCVS